MQRHKGRKGICLAHWRIWQNLMQGIEGEKVGLGRREGHLRGATSIPFFQAVKDGLFQWSQDLG